MFQIREVSPNVGHIVVLKNTVSNVPNTVVWLSQRYTLPVFATYTQVMKGFSTNIPAAVLSRMMQRESALIASVEDDVQVEGFAQTVPWGISRVAVPNVGTSSSINAHLFVLDTGVSSRNSDLNVVESISFVRKENADDMHGHGTAVAGVAAARDNTSYVVGVAPGAKIHSYKVLDRNGSGSFSSVIAGIDRVMVWKTQNPAEQNKLVINLSLGAFVGTNSYNVLDNAVVKAIQAGITCVVAAGNSGDSAVLYSPAHVTEAITVGAYDQANRYTSWSNHGSAVDILAPGANITTTGLKNNLVVASGTSFSAPHVAGAAVRYLAAHPTATPASVATAISTAAINEANSKITVNYPNTTDVSLYVPTL